MPVNRADRGLNWAAEQLKLSDSRLLATWLNKFPDLCTNTQGFGRKRVYYFTDEDLERIHDFMRMQTFMKPKDAAARVLGTGTRYSETAKQVVLAVGPLIAGKKNDKQRRQSLELGLFNLGLNGSEIFLVMELVLKGGKTVEQCATKFHMSANDVETVLLNILPKLPVSD